MSDEESNIEQIIQSMGRKRHPNCPIIMRDDAAYPIGDKSNQPRKMGRRFSPTTPQGRDTSLAKMLSESFGASGAEDAGRILQVVASFGAGSRRIEMPLPEPPKEENGNRPSEKTPPAPPRAWSDEA